MIDPTYQFDTPLPATAQFNRHRISEEGETSIGELAPKGLS